MRTGVARFEVQSALELALGRGPVPVVHCQTISERRMRFGYRVVNLERADACFAGFWDSVFWSSRRDAKTSEYLIRVGQANVGQRISRIRVDSGLEVVDRLLDVLVGAFVPAVTSPQV